jgi:hypothetical protein
MPELACLYCCCCDPLINPSLKLPDYDNDVHTGSRAGGPAPFFCSLTTARVFSWRPRKSASFLPGCSCLPANQSVAVSGSRSTPPNCSSKKQQAAIFTCHIKCSAWTALQHRSPAGNGTQFPLASPAADKARVWFSWVVFKHSARPNAHV